MTGVGAANRSGGVWAMRRRTVGAGVLALASASCGESTAGGGEPAATTTASSATAAPAGGTAVDYRTEAVMLAVQLSNVAGDRDRANSWRRFNERADILLPRLRGDSSTAGQQLERAIASAREAYGRSDWAALGAVRDSMLQIR